MEIVTKKLWNPRFWSRTVHRWICDVVQVELLGIVSSRIIEDRKSKFKNYCFFVIIYVHGTFQFRILDEEFKKTSLRSKSFTV